MTDPYEKLLEAEVEYLKAKGWVPDTERAESKRAIAEGRQPGWVEPPGRHRHRRVLNHGHAVNSQKANDAWERKFPGTSRPTQEESEW